MSKRLRVGILFGGRSGEHEVSIRSATSIVEKIDHKRYEVLPIAIGKDGKWLSPAASKTLLPQSTQTLLSARSMKASADVAILGDPSRQGLISLDNKSGLSSEKLDVIFPALHGPLGEDGTVQGLLEMADIPYAGCGVLASSCGMDKVAMKMLFNQAELPICKYIWFLRSHWRSSESEIIRKIVRNLGFPCFVKPANLGSSVGVSKATNKESLKQAVELAAQYDRKIIVEEGLDAREIECAILGNDNPKASLPGEYVVHDEAARFLDYTEKYTNTGRVQFVVPAPIPKALTAKIQRLAIRAFQAIDGAGLARVDFFLTRNKKELLVNELNTMPGLTEMSGYPKMWAASGVQFRDLFDRLIELAFERHREKSVNKTSI